MEQKVSWESIASQKRALRDAALAPFLQLATNGVVEPNVKDAGKRTAFPPNVDPKFQKITDINDIPTLLEGLRTAEFSAEDVALAYIKRWVKHT